MVTIDSYLQDIFVYSSMFFIEDDIMWFGFGLKVDIIKYIYI